MPKSAIQLSCLVLEIQSLGYSKEEALEISSKAYGKVVEPVLKRIKDRKAQSL